MTELGVQFEDSISMLVSNVSHVLLRRSFGYYRKKRKISHHHACLLGASHCCLFPLLPIYLTFLHLSRGFYLFIVTSISCLSLYFITLLEHELAAFAALAFLPFKPEGFKDLNAMH